MIFRKNQVLQSRFLDWGERGIGEGSEWADIAKVRSIDERHHEKQKEWGSAYIRTRA